jgi:uncharacterized protein (TIGR02996 family)
MSTLPRLEDVMPFLLAVWDRPTDALPRQIFADWLEEHGYQAAAEAQRDIAGFVFGSIKHEWLFVVDCVRGKPECERRSGRWWTEVTLDLR